MPHRYAWVCAASVSVTIIFRYIACIFASTREDEAAMPQPLGSRRPSETLPLAGNANKTGNTSFLGAVTTMLKFCIGTGVLAVPHAFSTGGVVPCALALLALLAWNDWAGRRLIQARDLLDADALRRFNTGGGESPLAALTREVCGAAVAGVVEAVFFVLMFGVAVAYLVALHDFVRATPLALPLGVDVALAAAAAVPLALVDDFGSLAAAGAAALVALACSLAAIALYGVMRRERLGWAQSGTFDWTKPDSVADVGAAVGVMAFCFGVVSDSEQKMNLNLTWSRRWRRGGAASPRRRRRGRPRVYVSRECTEPVSRRRRSTQASTTASRGR